ncbi:hypothetical protein [Nonlabens xiamenensis]|uniref:hypothetical protein n=1 Tax=Nonlabens xiamenensis TaxID=2341043 RepID=UPI000F60FAA7|nr:hypothetical protein [Nonlabens xiamenensis]
MQQLVILGKDPKDTNKRYQAMSELNLASTEVLEKLVELKKLPKAENMLLKKFGMIKMFVK